VKKTTIVSSAETKTRQTSTSQATKPSIFAKAAKKRGACHYDQNKWDK